MDRGVADVGDMNDGFAIKFANTADPSCVTIDDVARWCEELGQYIRDNHDIPDEWVQRSEFLHRRIKAMALIVNSLMRDEKRSEQNA